MQVNIKNMRLLGTGRCQHFYDLDTMQIISNFHDQRYITIPDTIKDLVKMYWSYMLLNSLII